VGAPGRVGATRGVPIVKASSVMVGVED